MKTLRLCYIVVTFLCFNATTASALIENLNETFCGLHSGNDTMTGYFNTFIGDGTGISNAGGTNDTFLGQNAGASNNSGSDNTALGAFAGQANTGGSSNVFVGHEAGWRFNGGWYNTIIGDTAGGKSDPGSTGSSNVFIGAGTGHDNTGSSNIFIGNSAGYSSGSGSSNIFIGIDAGHNETGSNMLYIANSGTNTPLIYGEFNNNLVRINGTLYATTGIQFPDGHIQTMALTGVSSSNLTAFGIGAGDSNSGGYNTFLGNNAGLGNTSGYANTFVGSAAGQSNLQGINNTFVGQASGLSHSDGDDNTFIGNGAGQYHKNGFGNTFVGSLSGEGSAANFNTGYANTFIGQGAGTSNTTGHSNVYIGASTGAFNYTGHGNVFIGERSGLEETGDNKLYIDNCYSGGTSCNKPLIKGDFAGRTVQIDGALTMVTVSTPSDIRYKKDIQPLESPLEKVLQLKGVTYAWNMDKVTGAGYKDGRQIGLVAQEVEKVLPELVQTNGEGYKTLSYDKLVPVLVEAMKVQQTLIGEKEARIEKLERDNERIIRELQRLAAQIQHGQDYLPQSPLSGKVFSLKDE